MTDSFRALGVSDAVCAALANHGIETPFEIQSMAIPEALAGGDVLAKSPTGSGKTLAFAIPIVERLDVEGPTPSALILVPTRELASQVTDEIELVGRPLGVRVASVYGGVPLKSQADRARGAHVVVATPGRLQDLVDRRMLSIDAVSGPRARRGRPDARHGLQAAGRPDRATPAGRPPDDVLLGDARRRGRRAGAPLHALAGPLRRRAAGGAPQRRGRPPLRSGHDRQQGADPRRAPAGRTTGSRSSSCGRRPAPTGSSRSCAGTTSTRSPSTATRRRSQRERALERFDSGKVRTLVATDVAARGLDVDGSPT